MPRLLAGAVSLWLLVAAPGTAAPPDLTNGGVPGDTISFNLGPTGARGWVHHVREDTSESRQILVMSVAAGSPAEGILAANDVILGADGTGPDPGPFTGDARKALGLAIGEAEARSPATLKLLRWRGGVTDVVAVTLRTMGAYSATAPYNCPKSELILERGLQAIMAGETSGRYSFATLTLLAANDPSDPDNPARMARAQTEARALIPSAATMAQMMADERDATSMVTWSRGHTLVVLTEYYLATGDTQVLPAIEAFAVNIARNQSLFGTVGHIFAEKNLDGSDNGPMGGVYGPVNSTGLPCFLGLLLARECGLSHPGFQPTTAARVEAAIERTSRFFAYYAGRGSIPYGEHEALWQGHENNGKSGLTALCFALQPGRVDEGRFFSKMAAASGSKRGEGHTGAFFNYVWAPLGAAAGGEEAAASHFSRISWMLDLNRRWDDRFDYDCLSGEGPNSGSQYNDFRMSTAALLTYALPLRQLHITGRGHDPARELTSADVAEAAAADVYNAAARTTTELVADLGSWSPLVQRRSAEQLATRSIDSTLLAQITALATDPGGSSRIGACYTLGKISNSSTANARAATLAGLLTDSDNHVRFIAAESMRYLPDSAKLSQLNAILSAAASTATPLLPFDEEDPLHFAHGRLAMLLFYSGNAYGPKGVIWGNKINSPTVIDRNLLHPAIRAVAANPIGQARSTLAETYKNLTAADVNALAETLVDSIHFRAPSDKMFSAGIRQGGIFALEKYNIAEGVPLSIAFMVEDGRGDNYTYALGVLEDYAGSCTTVRPDPDVIGFCQSLLGGGQAAAAQAVLDAIAADPNPTFLTSFKSVLPVTADATSLNLPANQTTLRASASDLAAGDLVYTWRQLHGAGSATFTPNGTAAAKDCAIQIDGVAGRYGFEVTVSDSRGFTEVSDSIVVTLRNPDGTLPPNDPPTADPQWISAAPASITPITLSGTDPEGYPLVFTITGQPAHGTLTGTVPDLVYTAAAGYLGADSFTFEVMDSDGQTSSATVSITVDAVSIETYVYEPFDYPTGHLAGRNGGSGMAGAWADGPDNGYANIYDETAAISPVDTRGNGSQMLNWDGVVNNLPTLPATGSRYVGVDGVTAPAESYFEAYRPLAQSAGEMAGADGVLWMSAVWHYPNNSTYGAHVGLALATDCLRNRGQNLATSGGYGSNTGDGIGVARGSGSVTTNSYKLNPTIFDNGTIVAQSIGPLPSSTKDNVVILKFEFGATDTVSAWFFNEDQTLSEEAFAANAVSVSGTVDENTLNVVTFDQNRGQNAIDEIRIGNSFASVIGVEGPPPDTTPPTLASITDGRGGEAMQQGQSVTYTLVFSESLAAASLDPSDFGNAGTAAIAVDSILQTLPGTVAVTVTPGTPGSLRLRVVQGAAITDLSGNLLDTSSALEDDIVITVNPATTLVPFVVGMSQAAAEAEITSGGLDVGTVDLLHHESIPVGNVISQNPSGGTDVPLGSSVDLVVSLGPAMTTVPAVTGLAQAAAESAITAANLVLGIVTTQNHATIPAGSVISQNPSGGANVVENSAVDLVVSLGPVMTTVPAVTGLAQAAAESAIIAANLVVGVVTTQNDATIPEGSVISQNPSGGASVAENSAVDLVVSLGPSNGIDVATADIPVSGTVAGTYQLTHASDNVGQQLGEIESGGAKHSRHSYLEHKWSFEVTGGDTVTFHVEAHHTANSENDHFVFAWSSTGADGVYQNMLTVSKTADDDTTQSFLMPPGTNGTIHVRVVDTDRTAGNSALDTLSIDRMFFLSETVPPVSDVDLWRALYPGADLADLAADLDGDGLSNGDERIWGLDPTDPSSVNPYDATLDPSGTFRYKRREASRTGLTYSIWYSSNLTQWFEDTSATQVAGPPDANQVETVTVTLGPGVPASPTRFVQVRTSE